MSSEEKRRGRDLAALEADGDLFTVHHSKPVTSLQAHLGQGLRVRAQGLKYITVSAAATRQSLHLLLIISRINNYICMVNYLS